MRRRSAIAAFGLLLGLAVAVPVIKGMAVQSIDSVRVTGEFQRVSRVALERAIEPYLGSGFLRVDVASIRHAARSLPWIKEVSVRRVWPGRLDVQVTERVAVARWGENELLETDATPFRPAGAARLDALPRLFGPPLSQGRVLERYRWLDEILADRLGARMHRLTLDAKGAWVAELSNGVSIVFGSDAASTSVARYAAAFPRLFGERLGELARIDLRYANGFAVRWRTPPVEEEMGS